MSARQLIVLGVAALAAVVALFLIRSISGRQATPTAAETQPIAGEQVLVAARNIPQGAALAPGDIAVRIFPQESVTASFVRVSQQPSAQADYVNAVTRRAFVEGEPITVGSVIQPEGRGFMAAQLSPGYRAVAIEIQDNTAAGGFIQPNDRVDLIVTQRVQMRDGSGGGEQVRSDIVLSDVRVLAVGGTTQTQTSGEAPTQTTASVAVLELTAADARIAMLAKETGQITLALRGVEVESVGLRGSRATGALGQSTGAVRVHAFGNVAGGS